jgi:hypothetical protein
MNLTYSSLGRKLSSAFYGVMRRCTVKAWKKHKEEKCRFLTSPPHSSSPATYSSPFLSSL